jgi:hypothetical protein
MMGETVANTVCGKKLAYNPGHWFNSAKFLMLNTKLMVGYLTNHLKMKSIFSGKTKREKLQ